ncbi:MAG: ATP-binding cassette domain-containing protein [Magnetococcales bacterium]|nr:ATP-binding cassette domain-containing protein [Magnetococcales bacterium]MBF0150420.1 ATP-binding cassette domain-containing protein [Magnetococcales bacterium]MBF0173952.1 ATP-binding cassette domain-containing protein [Magnetococcales bacterium]MBF0346808.1 ATP-binding cassette domain-containing protein [Magnetococcales bacterium]MBF0630952.1 ATP-binding cassette domain-containing protein [Magnetococcales bacterium]
MTTMLLEVNQLHMRFGGVVALHDVTFDVKWGSITALIGPNGAGKTTAFNCITGFYKAQQGRLRLHPPNRPTVDLVQILGQPFSGSDLLHPGRLWTALGYKMFGGPHLVCRAGIARTFQNVRLFKEMTVLENLLVAQHAALDRHFFSGLFNTATFRDHEATALNRANDLLDFFELSKEANRLAGHLSHGHQRRVEIARAMCTGPILLCLDEPAAGLNPMETQALSGWIRRLQKEMNLTILLIEHDIGLVMELSDHIVVLNHGEVIARGTPAAIQQNSGVVEAYLG